MAQQTPVRECVPVPVFPVASELHPPDLVRAVRERLLARLRVAGPPIRVVESERELAGETGGLSIILVLTGGSEAAAVRFLSERGGPVLVLAHPRHNSLPAALEILAWIRQQGRAGRVEVVRDEPAASGNITLLSRVIAAQRALQSLCLGVIGAPSDWLVASGCDAALVRNTWGPTVVSVPLADLRAAMAQVGDAAVRNAANKTLGAAAGCDEPTNDEVQQASRVELALRALVAERGFDAVSLRCFDFVGEERTTGCLALSRLNDEGVVAGCEGDVPATLTMAWLSALALQPTFMANPQDIDAATGDVWLAHCTVARRLTRSFRLRSHFESGLGVGIAGELPLGTVTVARIGGRRLDRVFFARGELVANESDPARCRTQVRVRLASGVDELLRHPLGNHLVLVPGDWTWPLQVYGDWFVTPVDER